MKRLLRGSVEATCSAHTREIAGSIPAPATILVIVAILLSGAAAGAETLTASYYSVQSLKSEGTFKKSKGVMANGKVFSDYGFTCATWLYDLGTVLVVKDIATGKAVEVTVTDRISRRFARTRVDLSKRAFEVLSGGRLDKGLLQVSVSRKGR